MEADVDHIWPTIAAVSIRPYKGRFFDCPSSCAKGHCVALGCTRACPRAMDISPGYNHLISNKREWNNCFIKNAQKILRILPDCICKNNRFSACTVYTIFGEHGNGSCTMMAKPIRALEFDSQKYSNDSTSLLNSHQNRFPLDFFHRFNVILPSVTRSPFRSVHDRPCLLLGWWQVKNGVLQSKTLNLILIYRVFFVFTFLSVQFKYSLQPCILFKLCF